MAPRSVRPVLVLGLLTACSAEPGRPSPDPAPAKPVEVAPEVPFGGRPGDGVPHGSPIDLIAVAPDGSAALTRDQSGGVRVWPALDGSAQPQLVPVRGARQLSLARSAGGLTLALVDGARGLRLLRSDERGRIDPKAPQAAPRERQVIEARVLPGGEHVVALCDDHSIELLDPSGVLLARLDHRGFRPVAIEADAAGKSLVAISVEAGEKSHAVAIHRIDVETGAKNGLALRPAALELEAPAVVGPSQSSLSPSGRHLALLAVERAGKGWQLIAADLERGTHRSVELPFPPAERVAVGFIDDSSVVAMSSPTRASWRIDLGGEPALFAHRSPSAQVDVGPLQATASGTRVASAGTWLWVESAGREPVYLGYEQFEPHAAAISPARRWVAWVNVTGRVYMRGLGGAVPPRVEVRGVEPGAQIQRAYFLDERRLVLVDDTGAIRTVDWTTGDEIDAIDAGGPAQDVELDGRRGLLRVTRPGQVWLYRASPAHGFRGPILLGDNASRSGFLATGGAALWTIDQSSQLRTYRLDELERGIGRDQSQARGVTVEHAILAVDRQGRFYAQSITSGAGTIERFSGPRRADLERSFDFQTPVGAAIFPSPDGARVAFARGDGVLTVFAAGRDARWSRSLIASHGPVWSEDGALLAIPGRLGAVVLDAATGAQVDLTCGPWFEVRRTLPPLRHVSQPQPGLCESAP